ncbi:MAG: Rieske (2Fe-2S) protein [Desulfofustis sp.]|nr:Rieske (2Fe-2S) protein [Desulfofustis sp.]MBT8345269.1 Rieske (2Fe-2S) protein [Desulfofustis sp.]NNF45746.1 Rieske (2Fe-2S) protein [Desulfofustis sp.]NNK14881.1 Rieske (2Fe-2S) protein [Desulfofustis sp.]NNK56062.1 Rieske (2Fe-2S) protein [Desulfofustis sp.]
MEQQRPISSKTPRQSNRRALLNKIWALIAAVAFIELGWFGSSLLKSRKTRNTQLKGIRYIEAGRVESFKPGQVKAVPEAMLFLACLEDNRFIALSKTCTHLGCALAWDEGQQKFVCPCHGSTFDRAGIVLTAPALRPLDFFPVRIEDGTIRIEITKMQRRESFDESQTTRV